MRYQINGKLKDGRAAVFESGDCEGKDDARHFFSHYFSATDQQGNLVEVKSLDWRTLKPLTPNVEFSGVPAGHSSNHPAGGTSAGTQG